MLTIPSEFYADPPITPAEHEEERETYSSSIAFHERMQSCIQKYRARRNLDSVRNNILTKYFMLGGIEASTTKAFTGGLDKATIEESTAEEIRAIKATDYVSTGNKKYYDPLDTEGWVVDFEGVAKGFLCVLPHYLRSSLINISGHRIPTQFATDREEDIKLYAAVIRNFLNYVLAHAVCPEYNDDVMAAREICNKAETELTAVKRLGYAFPGDFNVAASTLYGGRYENRHISTQAWEDDIGGDAVVSMLGGLSVANAERIFKTAIAFDGGEKMFAKVMAEDVKIINTESRCFEVVEIQRTSEESLRQYASVKNAVGEAGAIKALGVMVVKPWEGPGVYEEDFTDDEADTVVHASGEKLERFWVEDETLKDVFIGLKMEVIVNELDIGIKFFDGIEGLYCSFHAYLPNEKMNSWKEPGKSTASSELTFTNNLQSPTPVLHQPKTTQTWRRTQCSTKSRATLRMTRRLISERCEDLDLPIPISHSL